MSWELGVGTDPHGEEEEGARQKEQSGGRVGAVEEQEVNIQYCPYCSSFRLHVRLAVKHFEAS